MKHKLAQSQRLQQRMALTPQMRQSIELLAMPSAELNEYIDAILEKNPFLKKMTMDSRGHLNVPRAGTSSDSIEPQITSGVDPRQSLISQLAMLRLTKEEMKIAEYLVYEIDDNGYMTCDIDDAAADLGADIEKVEKVLEAIQEMEPPGIGARDARECLELQLKRLGKADSLEQRIVRDHLNELASNDARKVALRLKIGENEVLKAFAAIKKLNPKPASTLLSKKEDPVIPDIVAHIKGKRVSVGVNRDLVPTLTFYNPYAHKPDMINDPEVREFVKANESAARGLLDSLKRREETLCKVASYMLNFQAASLKAGGRGAMKSITIKDVAKALGFHPSTISRAVSNKYVQVAEKALPLSGLLSGGMERTGGGMVSKSSVLEMIASIIKGEDGSRPLGDDAIKEALAKEGIAISRRTVAKYRNRLKILPKHLRKRSSPA